jgi:hypothetical protein
MMTLPFFLGLFDGATIILYSRDKTGPPSDLPEHQHSRVHRYNPDPASDGRNRNRCLVGLGKNKAASGIGGRLSERLLRSSPFYNNGHTSIHLESRPCRCKCCVPRESILFFVLTGLASGQPVTLNTKIFFVVAKLMVVVEAILTKIEWPTLVVAMLVSNLAVLHQNIRLRAIRTWDRWGRKWRISAFIATGGNEALRSVRVVRAAVALRSMFIVLLVFRMFQTSRRLRCCSIPWAIVSFCGQVASIAEHA